MKKFSLLFSWLLFVFSSSFAQSIIYVTPTGAGNNSGSSWANALVGTELANRVAKADSGTQFWVAAGTYNSDELFIQKSIQIYGGFSGTETKLEERMVAPNETVFSGNNSQPVYTNNSLINISFVRSNQNLILDEITIREGHNNTFSGGINCFMLATKSTLLISNCRFINNKPADGSALNILVSDSASCNLTIKNCFFTGNSGVSGGTTLGLLAYSLSASMKTLIEDCIFSDNSGIGSIYSLSGPGAILSLGNYSSSSSLKVNRCRFLNNNAFRSGGVMRLDRIRCEIENSIFANNSVTYDHGEGGVIYIGFDSKTLVKNCTFRNNSAAYGGVVYTEGSNNVSVSQVFLNCNFTNNFASVSGGVFGNLLVDHLSRPYTILPNEISVKNCLIWQNVAPDAPVFKAQVFSTNTPPDNTFSPTYSLIQNGYPGTGNLNTDPLFIDAANGDFRLKPNSPAINSGDPNTVDLPNTDLAGQPRVQGGRVDMGAYEFFNCFGFPCLPFTVERKK